MGEQAGIDAASGAAVSSTHNQGSPPSRRQQSRFLMERGDGHSERRRRGSMARARQGRGGGSGTALAGEPGSRAARGRLGLVALIAVSALLFLLATGRRGAVPRAAA